MHDHLLSHELKWPLLQLLLAVSVARAIAVVVVITIALSLKEKQLAFHKEAALDPTTSSGCPSNIVMQEEKSGDQGKFVNENFKYLYARVHLK